MDLHLKTLLCSMYNCVLRSTILKFVKHNEYVDTDVSVDNNFKNTITVDGAFLNQSITEDISEVEHDTTLYLPYPFSLLNVRPSKSSSGKCWLFHMTNNGIMSGYLFPSGYRLFGLKSTSFNDGTFFMENRNF